MVCGFASLMCTQVTRLMVVSREHTLRTTALGEGHLCGKVTHLCVKDEEAHLSIMARSLLSTKDHMPSIRLRSLLYSQWDSVAAPCAPGHLVPRIQQQPAEPPATGRRPPWSQVSAPVLPPCSHPSWASSSAKTPHSCPTTPLYVITRDCHVLPEDDGAVGCLSS